VHLIIPDAHAKPGVDNRRFDWLGKFALDLKPDTIIDMGDWEDMPSLSSYDYGKRCYEGRRYNLDLEAAWDARERFNAPINRFNEDRKRNHKPQYRPSMYALGGNHFEGRIERATQLTPMLEGTIGVADGRYEEFGWDYIPFKTPVKIDGVNYCHFFTSGVMGKPIGGEMPALSLVRKQLATCVQGHSHVLDFAHRTNTEGRRVWGVHAGCYLDPDQWEGYAGEANKIWWRGVVVLRNVKDGDFDIETISIQELQKRYG
jgi:hypothetical protein